jgi:hypothetical protein
VVLPLTSTTTAVFGGYVALAALGDVPTPRYQHLAFVVGGEAAVGAVDVVALLWQ